MRLPAAPVATQMPGWETGRFPAKPLPASACISSVRRARVRSAVGPASADAGRVSSVPSRRTISGSALRLAASLPCRAVLPWKCPKD
jgi:hypothetical protein